MRSTLAYLSAEDNTFGGFNITGGDTLSQTYSILNSPTDISAILKGQGGTGITGSKIDLLILIIIIGFLIMIINK